jgi:tetratricopeptide (TPR) repeat protein
MRRCRVLWVLVAACAARVGAADHDAFDRGLVRLKSGEAFDRERGEVEIRNLGGEALRLLVPHLDSQDRLFRFRTERIFSDLLNTLLADLDAEHQSMVLDENELAIFRARKDLIELRKELGPRLDEWKKAHPRIEERVPEMILLERLEARDERAAKGEGLALDPASRTELERLRKAREEWRKEDPEFETRMKPLIEIGKLLESGVEEKALTELETLRSGELDERVRERQPRIEKLIADVEALGLPAWNGLLARKLAAKSNLGSYYQSLVERATGKLREELASGLQGAAFEARRYERSLLWALEVDARGSAASQASQLLDRHLASTLDDIADPISLIRERAEDELYLLGERGRNALAAKIQKEGPEAERRHRFLAQLLRWRLRPRVQAKVGMDFADYQGLEFRDRRRRVFAFAHAASEDAIPTLRALITDDSLEPSFFVKLAAAKALAGLLDMYGFNYLLARHPDMTLKKPEVSREILIIQGFQHIRDSNYQKAVEELRKVLDEYPFDFRANYHIAFAYLLLKNYAKAIHHFEVARRINPQDQLTLYNLACAYALNGQKREAVEALERSVESGFDDHEYIEQDKDFDSIRDEPSYRELIERMKS